MSSEEELDIEAWHERLKCPGTLTFDGSDYQCSLDELCPMMRIVVGVWAQNKRRGLKVTVEYTIWWQRDDMESESEWGEMWLRIPKFEEDDVVELTDATFPKTYELLDSPATNVRFEVIDNDIQEGQADAR